jgi:hypothetical protein
MIKELFSTPDEVHSFLLGMAETMFPRPKVSCSRAVVKIIQHEYWYYRMGNVIGILLQIVTGLVVLRLLKAIFGGG